jgi:hypothetical protein
MTENYIKHYLLYLFRLAIGGIDDDKHSNRPNKGQDF